MLNGKKSGFYFTLYLKIVASNIVLVNACSWRQKVHFFHRNWYASGNFNFAFYQSICLVKAVMKILNSYILFSDVMLHYIIIWFSGQQTNRIRPIGNQRWLKIQWCIASKVDGYCYNKYIIWYWWFSRIITSLINWRVFKCR